MTPPAVSTRKKEAASSKAAPVADERAALARARRAVRDRLLPWFEQNRRDMPWRRRRTPYRVWISELMLQQTRVDQAVPYFLRFLRAFPSVRRLAAAPLDAVLKQWEGLGYYRRARYLHAAARQIVEERGGHFPRTAEAWRTLPGVGVYTAAAIASLAFGEDAAVVDGNVVRVLARLFARDEAPGTAEGRAWFQAAADGLLVAGRAGACNEALMEWGATGCLPRAPRCGDCPLRRVCQAAAAGTPERWPRRTPRGPLPHKVVGAAVIENRRGDVLLARRRDEGLLGGLWEFPGGKQEPGETLPACIARELREEMGLVIDVGAHLVTVRHAYSHFTIELHAYRARIRQGRPRCLHCAAYAWAKPDAFKNFAFSRADLHIVEALRATASKGQKK